MKFLKWLRKWLYLVILMGMGIVYLAYVDEWQVYAEPLRRLKAWYEVQTGDESVIGTWVALLTGGEGTSPGQEDPGGNQDGSQDGWDGDSNDEEGVSQGEDSGLQEEDTSTGEGAADQPFDGEAGEGSGGDVPAEGEEPQEPVYVAVEDDYFADAVFIGDSRTVGLYKYSDLGEVATFYASTGLNVYKLFDSEIVSVPGERKQITVEEALQQNTFSKIYLMLGINEMGIGTADSFLAKYYEVVVHLQELQPDAIIYLQGIMKVTSERSDQGDYINNLGIDVRNVGIEALADNQKTFYLDVNPFLCDETGALEPSYTFDGVHLKAKYYEIWKDFLKTHAISS